MFHRKHAPEGARIPELLTKEDYDALRHRELAIVFKHSSTCPVSIYVHDQVLRFRAEKPDVPVYMVSVRKHRDLARYIQERTGVIHESPQILVLRWGNAVRSASHGDITTHLLTSYVLEPVSESQ